MDSMHATAGGRRETDEEPGVGVVPSNVFETVALLGRRFGHEPRERLVRELGRPSDACKH